MKIILNSPLDVRLDSLPAGRFCDVLLNYPAAASLLQQALEDYCTALAAGVPAAVEASDATGTVTPLQMRRALNAAGLRTAVEAAVAAASQDVRDAWEFATVIVRTDPLLTALAADLGKTEADLDALFAAAAQF
jgi:hypothetical protein